MHVAFIGVGNMGRPMLANLLKKDFAATAYDIVPAALDAAAALGASRASSPAEAAAAGDLVITILPSSGNAEAAYLGARGVIEGARRGTLCVDMSTIDPGTSQRIAARLAEKGIRFIDAPVSGGVGGATAGTLTFMCGGSDEAFARAKPILENMGKRIVHCGGPGAGQAAKICNNMILGATMIVTCEAFALAEKLGLSAQALFDVASTASGQSWSLTTYCPVPGPVPTSPANRDYKPGFAAALMLKDLRLAQEAASGAGASTPLGAEAAQLYALYVAAGHSGDDFSGIINFLRGASQKH